jgi:hypothetical protein
MGGRMKNSDLKQQYLDYFEDTPVQKYAAMFIGKDEDTIIRWKKQDKQFADAVQRRKAIWIRKRVINTKAEYALEKLEAEIFAQKNTIEQKTPQMQYRFGIQDERGKYLSQKYMEFMMHVTKRTAESVDDELRKIVPLEHRPYQPSV